jgi:hypothetical protein
VFGGIDVIQLGRRSQVEIREDRGMLLESKEFLGDLPLAGEDGAELLGLVVDENSVDVSVLGRDPHLSAAPQCFFHEVRQERVEVVGEIR